MLQLKPKKLTIVLGLALFGMLYFSALSNWEINNWLKNYFVLVPLQIMALLYVYLYWNRSKIKIEK
jgi:hypothetical protein